MLSTTQHFNQLSEAEAERLAILIEECSEVIKIGCKILRHGYRSVDPTAETPVENRSLLDEEIGHIQASIDMLLDCGDVDQQSIYRSYAERFESVKKYLHHQ